MAKKKLPCQLTTAFTKMAVKGPMKDVIDDILTSFSYVSAADLKYISSDGSGPYIKTAGQRLLELLTKTFSGGKASGAQKKSLKKFTKILKRGKKNNSTAYFESLATNVYAILDTFDVKKKTVARQTIFDFLKEVESFHKKVKSGKIRRGVEELVVSCTGPLSVQGTYYQLKIAREVQQKSGWKAIAAIEDKKKGVRGMDLIFEDGKGFPPKGSKFAPASWNGRLIEAKSGTSIKPNQVIRHFINYESDVVDIRWVLNTKDTKDLKRAAGEIWVALGKLWTGDAVIKKKKVKNRKVVRKVLKSIGFNANQLKKQLTQLDLSKLPPGLLKRLRKKYVVGYKLDIPLKPGL